MVKYRSRLVRGYGKGASSFNKKDGQWFNFWLLISAIFTFLFFALAFSGADSEEPLIAIIGLLGLISWFTTPMMFFTALAYSKLSYGLPNLSEFFANKTTKKIEPIYSTKPLEGYEDCSPQFQAYMRGQIAKKRNKQKP